MYFIMTLAWTLLKAHWFVKGMRLFEHRFFRAFTVGLGQSLFGALAEFVRLWDVCYALMCATRELAQQNNLVSSCF